MNRIFAICIATCFICSILTETTNGVELAYPRPCDGACPDQNEGGRRLLENGGVDSEIVDEELLASSISLSAVQLVRPDFLLIPCDGIRPVPKQINDPAVPLQIVPVVLDFKPGQDMIFYAFNRAVPVENVPFKYNVVSGFSKCSKAQRSREDSPDCTPQSVSTHSWPAFQGTLDICLDQN
ncbi:hypothetical protein FRX31_004437 [Thalictrum thalictroides]|uniref:Uncharacterized protein n=1 Tax=Thalictrum thalictroides TaxID=46969 RepID=A0A7J6XAW6_THATH|nr:hypothetical protein FRX31_004437 [Thalictrum thalictroides]